MPPSITKSAPAPASTSERVRDETGPGAQTVTLRNNSHQISGLTMILASSWFCFLSWPITQAHRPALPRLLFLSRPDFEEFQRVSSRLLLCFLLLLPASGHLFLLCPAKLDSLQVSQEQRSPTSVWAGMTQEAGKVQVCSPTYSPELDPVDTVWGSDLCTIQQSRGWCRWSWPTFGESVLECQDVPCSPAPGDTTDFWVPGHIIKGQLSWTS